MKLYLESLTHSYLEASRDLEILFLLALKHFFHQHNLIFLRGAKHAEEKSTQILQDILKIELHILIPHSLGLACFLVYYISCLFHIGKCLSPYTPTSEEYFNIFGIFIGYRLRACFTKPID